MTPWRPGALDIHVLSTGRGDAALIVGPQGDLVLVDAGAATGDPNFMLPGRPDTFFRSPGTTAGPVIAAYVQRRMRETGAAGLGALVATHLHDDHVSGIACVARELPIALLVDPDFPDYGYPAFEGAEAIERYVAFARARAAAGGRVEALRVGRTDQILLPGAELRAVAARGVVWTGEEPGNEGTAGSNLRSVFPPRSTLAPSDYPNENGCCGALRLRFGGFSAFFGGDLTDWADAGARPWMDALTPTAEAIGRVDVALVPHHGLYDATGPRTVRALSPKVWIVSAWHVTHPSPSTVERLFHPRLNPRLSAVYATGMSDAAVTLSGRFGRQFASRSGHVVVRVDPGGEAFRVVVTDDRDEADRVVQVRTVS